MAIAPGTEVNLEVKLLSGQTLATVTAGPSWTTADLKQLPGSHVTPDKRIGSLMHGDRELGLQETVAAAGLVSGAVLQAVLVGVPLLHVFRPCSARELSERRGCGFGFKWLVGGSGEGHIVADHVQHSGMDSAPQAGKEVATAMATVAPNLENIIVLHSESQESGEILVISNPGQDPKQACISALALLDRDPEMGESSPNIHEHATLVSKDWNEHLERGFSCMDEAEGSLLAITKIMADSLEQHFEVSFEDEVVTAPVFYGGYASDGSIVGVLSARVWT
ncbi:unnamed protein product [Polarella glacialis]|uniref:Uncharacterized protein n=1 Tax=Polarella glacialis TaxID=89957 RepID=A0A813L3I8_POLGL|nr:unnamed protein product [Polarella glacialis]CAE8718672.1 unnamed protein product [Polarella glacialis]